MSFNFFNRKVPTILLERKGNQFEQTKVNLIRTEKGFYDKENKQWLAFPKRYFRTYKEALKFLQMQMAKNNVLSNYEPSDIEIALYTLFKSKIFMKKIK